MDVWLFVSVIDSTSLRVEKTRSGVSTHEVSMGKGV